MIEPDEMKHLSRVFSALGSHVRLRILSTVSDTERPLHIKAVAKALNMDYAAIYRHVDVLKNAGLLRVYEVGRSRVLSTVHADLMEQILSLVKQMKP